MKKKLALCHFCGSRCSVKIQVKGGLIQTIEANDKHPKFKILRATVAGCQRIKSVNEWYGHEDRLKYPLKRVGGRGEGKWKVIPWDEALDEIAGNMLTLKEKYGPETVATTVGTSRTDDQFRMRFFNVWGSPNSISAADGVCFAPFRMTAAAVFGWPVARLSVDDTTKLLLLVGSNPIGESRAYRATILRLKKRGCKIIVVDPRKSETAAISDLWLQIRPGTDVALLMGMINLIIERNLYDKEFVKKWCYGFDRLSQRAKEFPIEKVEEVTWIPAKKIRDAATLFATIKPASASSMMGIEQTYCSIQAIHSLLCLVAITGNVDIQGGFRLRHHHELDTPDYEIELNELVMPPQKAKQIGFNRFKFQAYPGFDMAMKYMKRKLGRSHLCHAHGPLLYRAILKDDPYPIKAMITVASNPMVTAPNTKLVYQAIKKLDLYVVSDYWLTPSAELADYVLPAASWLERPVVFDGWNCGTYILLGERVFPPVIPGKWERKNDYELWRGLASRTGLSEYFPWETLEEAYNWRLRKFGKTIAQLIEDGGVIPIPQIEKKYEQEGFGTPSGKVELYSKIFEQLGYDPLPFFCESPESPVGNPELAKEYPLILITGVRHFPFFHSEHRQVEKLRKMHPYPIVEIHPESASKLGISDGDWIWIETVRGRVRQKCRYSEAIHPQVVSAQHGWWFPEYPGEDPWLHGVWESNINVITDDDPNHCNPINGGWPLRGELCKVYRAKTY